MNWEKDRLNLGTIKAGSSIKFFFKSTKDLQIASYTPSCGKCTIVGPYKNRQLAVTYRASKVPKHLVMQGKNKYTATQGITVKYLDGTQEQLIFTVTIQ